MTTEPDRIRAEVEALLDELPGDDALPAEAGLTEVARRLEAVHQVLVDALESVEKG